MQQQPIISYSSHDGYPPDLSEPPASKEGWKSVLSTILILVSAPIIAIFLTAYVFQSYEVDGPSMETTLQNQDRLIVMKLGKSMAKMTNKKYIPKRYEIIVFQKNESTINGQDVRQLIKRVIGLPGDRVVVQNGHFTVYNKEFPNGFDPDQVGGYGAGVTSTTPGNVNITVPEGEVFVSGDNRTNSLDSRSFGTVPADDIVGDLSLRIYPFSKFQSF